MGNYCSAFHRQSYEISLIEVILFVSYYTQVDMNMYGVFVYTVTISTTTTTTTNNKEIN